MTVKFQDKGFEKIVLAATGGKDKVTPKLLSQISSISISEEPSSVFQVPWHGSTVNTFFPRFCFGIRYSENGKWIEELANYFSHIKALHLEVPTSELSFLKDFTNLEQLCIEDSSNTDWSFLSGLLHLQNLHMVNCYFADLTPLQVLSIKQDVVIQHELEHGKNLKLVIIRRLQHLSLLDCKISDISPLAKCRFISDLNLSHNLISDLSPLAEMAPALYYLTMRYNNITEVSPLRALRGTYLINLRHNHISDVSVFVHLTTEGYLSRLFLEHNKIEDFSELSTLRFVDSDFPRYRGSRNSGITKNSKSFDPEG